MNDASAPRSVRAWRRDTSDAQGSHRGISTSCSASGCRPWSRIRPSDAGQRANTSNGLPPARRSAHARTSPTLVTSATSQSSRRAPRAASTDAPRRWQPRRASARSRWQAALSAPQHMSDARSDAPHRMPVSHGLIGIFAATSVAAIGRASRSPRPPPEPPRPSQPAGSVPMASMRGAGRCGRRRSVGPPGALPLVA
jgi:hypothetical protein